MEFHLVVPLVWQLGKDSVFKAEVESKEFGGQERVKYEGEYIVCEYETILCVLQ